MSTTPNVPAQPTARRALPARLGRSTLALVMGGLVAVGGVALPLTGASAASVSGAAFSGTTGTVSVGGTLYAKPGASVRLTVATSNDTMCVDVTGAHSGHQESDPAKTSWTFDFPAASTEGAHAVTATASPGFNKHGACTGQTRSLMASYVVDNTGPQVTAALSPAPNAAGWNRTDTTVTWTATDAGSGVATGPTPASPTVTANGIGTHTSTATDRLGHSGTGSVIVRVDKAAPSITASQVQNADGTTTITFTCEDSNSGGGEASGIASCLAAGSATNSRTVQPGTSVTGTATDTAGNTSTVTSTAPAGDTSAPTLSGAPKAAPNGANGWYTGDVVIGWTASDPESGIPTQPADTTITGEGTGLTSTTTVRNGAGLSTTATSAPPVKIDRTAPVTGLSGTSNAWSADAVTLTLTATDNLAGIASTTYVVDGGAPQEGTSLRLTTDGEHTVEYFSTDRAGNREATRSATVRIDRTAPSIRHLFDPAAYTDGAWTNRPVTVTFECADQGGSGLASCTAPVTKGGEGAGQQVVGTARDHAGNTATDTATVSIDTTAPSIEAVPDRAPNGAGWYGAPVTVRFLAGDDLSGVARVSDPVVLREGADQSVTGTATDAAGNTSSASLAAVDVDLTDPTLRASFAGGWHTGAVAVDWTCTDGLSGVATDAADDTVSGEGENLSSSATCADRAGNVVNETVTGIRIDATPPTTQAEAPEAPVSGWHTAPVDVTLTGADNLSGVDRTFYTVDGGAEQVYEGSVTVGAEGVHSIRFWSRDVAGNVEEAGAPLVVRVDRTAPVTTVTNPISPDSGWFVTSGIPFAFGSTDGHSGVAATYYTIDGGEPQVYGEPFTRDLSTGQHTVTYWSEDLAGNDEAVRSFQVNVDTVEPAITGTQSPVANAHGWNNADVKVTFACTDEGSGVAGVAGCAGDTTLVNEGEGQQVTGDAVDVAGNRSSTTFGPVNIDKTRPTLTGVPTDAYAGGWHNDDVVVRWVGDDGLSGLDPATQPANSVVTGEGDNLSAGPVTIKDKAGNESAPAVVPGIKIDRTPPVVTGAPTERPNAGGWYNGAVTVDFTCTDNLSGVASCPTSRTVSTNGAGQAVTSGPASDVAGNVSSGTTVGGINVDGLAPTTTADNQCTKVNDWCKGDYATVLLSATDQAGLSGVREIHYRVDGGDVQVVPGATETVSVPLSGSGAGTVTYWAVDAAGNTEEPNNVSLKWDNIAPSVSHTLTPAPNADGWNKGDVTVHFDARDDDRGSGVAPGSVTADVTVTEETAGRDVEGSATDVAGNVGHDSVTVRLDRTAPEIAGRVTSGTLGDNGWYVGPVTVGFTCSDGLSGIADGACPSPATLSANGTGLETTGTVTDRAGNPASATVGDIRIDQEKPTITYAGVNVAGMTYELGATPSARCTASDSFSGVASCTVEVTGGNANGVGTFTWTATATDNAGNVSTLSGTYAVKYRWGGFLQPINDTAHQVNTSTSIFKAGSTVPVKFQLKRSDGSVVQSTSAPVWLTPAKGSTTTAAVDESVYALQADTGVTFRHDATAQQYLYTWKSSSTGGHYWRIGVRLDDGQTYYVNIGLR